MGRGDFQRPRKLVNGEDGHFPMGYSDDYNERPRREDPASRPRSGNTPPRGSGTPSRPRSGNTPPRSNLPPRQPSGNTPPRSLGRRVRDAFTDAYEAISREVRSLRSRPAARRPDDEWDDRRAPSVSRPTARRYRDDDESRYRPAASASAAAPVAEPVASHPRRSLTLRLIKRRQRLRSPAVARRITVRATIITIVFLLLVSATGFSAGYAYFINAEYAQRINELAINRDFQTTRIYDRNGTLLYQTFGSNYGRRTYLTYCQIPPIVQDATVDTEDNSFWTNSGVDVQSEIRALITDIQTHGAVQGGSTITQQLVKLSVLGNSQKSLTRKIPEAILAVGITQRYTKQQILTMYLNQISYTALDYGIEAAAENVFGLQEKTVSLDPNQFNSLTPVEQNYVRHLQTSTDETGKPCIKPGQTTALMSAAWQLQPWQATLLAGFPDNPPSIHEFLCDAPDVACLAPFYLGTRQLGGVLDQMARHHPQDLQLGCSSGMVGCHPASPQEISNYTLQELCPNVTVAQNQQLLGCPKPKPGAATNFYPDNAFSTSTGLSTELAPYFVDYVIQQLSSELPGGFDEFASLGWNIYTTIDYGDPVSQSDLAKISIDPQTGQLDGMPKGKHVGVEQYAEYAVTHVIEQNYYDYWYCGVFPHPAYDANGNPVTLPVSENPFAGNQNPCLETPLDNPADNVYDGAVVVIDPRTGDILAMVGGADYNSTDPRVGGQNNLATAMRSMGSSFKPIVYATAFQMGWYPGMIIRDQPTCFPTAFTSKEINDQYLCKGYYLPHNDFHNTWSGAEPITYELGNSLNVPATMALSFVGLQANATSPLFSMAQRLGITSLDPSQNGPTTALGAQDVSLLQLTGAYGTFDNNGVHVPTRAILEVTSATGGPVYDAQGHQIFPYVAQPQGAQAISPEAAYMVSSVLSYNNARARDFGPNSPLNFQNRTVAGKTGTSQNTVDILTLGYTPGLVVGAWAGNANGEPMGNNIIGVAGAAYIYHAVMAFAIDELNLPGTRPSRLAPPATVGGYITPPSDMHYAIVNCQNGLAPYKGMSATTQCSPSKQDSVPRYMSVEWTFNSTKLDPGATWDCISWGCTQQTVGDPGIDYTWVVNGQDPVTP
jgi:membrane peptidoglycan carboxypeptidase